MRHSLFPILAAVCAFTLAPTAADAKDPIAVIMDRAKVMRLPSPADTVIIGNPAIADASIHDRLTLVLTGKAVGLTNLVILDAKGNPIADEVLSVTKVQEGLVTVQRANARFSYFCTPHCNAMMEVGDNQEHFSQAYSQLQIRTAFGQQGSTPGQ